MPVNDVEFNGIIGGDERPCDGLLCTARREIVGKLLQCGICDIFKVSQDFDLNQN